MHLDRIRYLRALLFCRCSNKIDEQIESPYEEISPSDSISSIGSSRQTFPSDESEIYDKILDEPIEFDSRAPYTPFFSPDDRIDEEIKPIKSYLLSQPNSKRELHKELIHRQKMGELLPKKNELLDVFKARRSDEKKREEQRKRPNNKLEEILARQRQKIDQPSELCSTSDDGRAFSNEFEFVFHRICQRKKD